MISHSSIGLAMLTIALTPDLETDLRRLSQEDLGETVEGLVCRLIRDAAAEARLGKPSARELQETTLDAVRQIRVAVADSLSLAKDVIQQHLAAEPPRGELRAKTAPADDAHTSEEAPTSSTPPTPSEPPASSQAPAEEEPAPSAKPAPKKARKPVTQAQRDSMARAREVLAAERAKKKAAEPAPVAAVPAARTTPKSPQAAGRRVEKDAAPDSKPKATTTVALLNRLRVQNIRIANLQTQDRSAWVDADAKGWAVEMDGYLCLTLGGAEQLGGKAPGPNNFLKLALPAPRRPSAPAGVPSVFGGE